MTTPSQRISAYAHRYWRRAKMQDWPTVNQVCRALKLNHKDVEENDGDDYCTTTFNSIIVAPYGQHFVEALTEAVDVDWCNYWKNYSPCTCGRHPERFGTR